MHGAAAEKGGGRREERVPHRTFERLETGGRVCEVAAAGPRVLGKPLILRARQDGSLSSSDRTVYQSP